MLNWEGQTKAIVTASQNTATSRLGQSSASNQTYVEFGYN